MTILARKGLWPSDDRDDDDSFMFIMEMKIVRYAYKHEWCKLNADVGPWRSFSEIWERIKPKTSHTVTFR